MYFTVFLFYFDDGDVLMVQIVNDVDTRSWVKRRAVGEGSR